MKTKIQKSLPWIAVISLAVLIISFIFVQSQLSDAHIEDPENRSSVEKSLADFAGIPTENMKDPAFLQAFETLKKQPHIATVWLFNAEGIILEASGSTARSAAEGDVHDLATAEIRDVLSSIPGDELTIEQQTMLLAASTIQREGEHNDIYNHILQPIYSSEGKVLGYIGIAYQINSVENTPSLAYKIELLLFAASFVLYWLSLPVWVYLDAKRRDEKAWVWSIFVLAGNFIALLAYLLVRPNNR